MGSDARKAGRADGSSETGVKAAVTLDRCESVEGWVPATYAKAFGCSFCAAQSRLYSGWRNGKFTRRRGRHPEYYRGVGWVYQEA